MKFRLKYILATVAFLTLLIVVFEMSYVVFKPKIFRDGKYQIIKVEKSFYYNLNKVLNYYNVSHQYLDGEISVRRSLMRDDELIYNYTNKALDDDWIKNHILDK